MNLLNPKLFKNARNILCNIAVLFVDFCFSKFFISSFVRKGSHGKGKRGHDGAIGPEGPTEVIAKVF